MKVWRDTSGTKRSPMNFSAHGSPALAAAPILRMAAAASLLSNCSAILVALWRAPLGLPLGLAWLPRAKVPSGFRPVFSGCGSLIARPAYPRRSPEARPYHPNSPSVHAAVDINHRPGDETVDYTVRNLGRVTPTRHP